MRLNIYSDGGARGNPGPGAIGVVVCNSENEIIAKHKDCIGHATNNIAEYLALIAAIELAKEFNGQEISFFLDSELVVKQMQGIYQIKNETLKQLWESVRKEIAGFKWVCFTHVPRTHEFIRKADQLVNQALDEAV